MLAVEVGGRAIFHSDVRLKTDQFSPDMPKNGVTLDNLNPREGSSWSRIFLISLVYVCMYLFMYLFVPRLLANEKTIQT